MDQFEQILNKINNWVWGAPLLILMLAVGLYLTYLTRFVQLRHLWLSNKLAFFSKEDTTSEGDISHFQALMTALAATIGIGSIAGVATAITAGGVGAIFWMWVAGLLGMATKYGEAILAIKFRVHDKSGQMCGGPMYYLSRGLNSRGLAGFFAVMAAITALGTGNMVQANSVAQAAEGLFHLPTYITGLFLILITAIPLLGGIQRIGRVVSFLVPTMAFFYIFGTLIIVCVNIDKVPHALYQILASAFTGQAASGGFLGAGVMAAIRLGVSRGVFSSEAGLGSSPIAAAAAKTDCPSKQALVSMSSVFITTGIVCTLTGLSIATTGVLGQTNANGELITGALLAVRAFEAVIPNSGVLILVALIPFAYSTMLGWAYYGEKAVEYLFTDKSIFYYRIVYICLILPGAMLNLKVVWGIANIMNGLMAFPNLIGLLMLGSIIAKETDLFDRSLVTR